MRAVNELAAWQESHGQVDRAERTRLWFNDTRANSGVLAVVRKRVEECADRTVWREWSADQKTEYVRVLLSPYAADDGLVNELVAEGCRRTRPRT